jgi:hypothetical protein
MHDVQRMVVVYSAVKNSGLGRRSLSLGGWKKLISSLMPRGDVPRMW